MMLFKLNARGNAVLVKEAVKICPEFKNLTDDQLLFVILAYDYFSKFHQFPEDERVRKAKLEVFGKEAFDEKQKLVRIAVDSYKGLQFDVRRETLNTYKLKISKLNKELLRDDIDAREMKDIMETISRLQKNVGELEVEIEKDMLSMELTSGKELSWLEKMQSNLEAYKKFKG